MVGRTWEAGRRAWGLAALALLLVLGGAAVLAVPYRHSLSTVRAYEAASKPGASLPWSRTWRTTPTVMVASTGWR